jgi:hypothetical protein
MWGGLPLRCLENDSLIQFVYFLISCTNGKYSESKIYFGRIVPERVESIRSPKFILDELRRSEWKVFGVQNLFWTNYAGASVTSEPIKGNHKGLPLHCLEKNSLIQCS